GRGTWRRKRFHRLSPPRGCRLNRLGYAFYALVVGRTRSFARHVQMGASAFDDFSFNHDVQPVELSQFQSHYLAHDSLASAICRHHSHHVLHRLELRMDAGGSVSDLFALRVSASVGFETLAA